MASSPVDFGHRHNRLMPGADPDRPLTPEELAECFDVDVRFIRLAEDAGLVLNANGCITARAFWNWFADHAEAFRQAAGMRRVRATRAGSRKPRIEGRVEIAMATIVEFFGVLPCDQALLSASEILKPSRGRRC